MTDPGAHGSGVSASVRSSMPAVYDRLLRRADFLRVAKGRRFHTSVFSVQAAVRDDPVGPPRFGFTVTRKTGGAVERNRMRRRLREAVRRAAALEARVGIDYVIVARRPSLEAGFDQLVSEMTRALRLVGVRAGPGGDKAS